ncbi:MAG: hypothetical protein LBK83_05545 [Treponema sp.]|jgi:hypothetical protein|nr:hypothetical protein [Treponema sp.]
MTSQHRQTSDDSLINWHSAFYEAIRLELAQFSALLDFQSEIPLNTAPLRIDLIIIKKQNHIPLMKNIAAIFRSINIFEYKSPTDYVSIGDFYKVYGYACLYASLEHVPVTECTLSFVESRHPRDLLAHFRKVRGYRVEERSPGIYTVSGDILPIQIIESKRLLAEENLWLRDLDNRLDMAGIREVAKAVEGLGKGAGAGAYLEVITRANAEQVKEALKMSKSAITLERVLEEAGLTTKWEARAKREVAEKLLKMGIPLKKVTEATGLDLKTVKSLIQGEVNTG